MKATADTNRRALEFQVGDKVLLKLDPHQFKPPKGQSSSLSRRYDGPFRIVAKVGKSAYKLELPAHLRVHPVFHVSVLRPFREDESDQSRNVPTRGPVFVQYKPDHEVDRILSGRVTGFGNQLQREYLVSWKGRPPEENSWEAE
jgi:ribosomal protein L21E